jgi:hypothetical protein
VPDKNTRGEMMNFWRIYDNLFETKEQHEIVIDWRI